MNDKITVPNEKAKTMNDFNNQYEQLPPALKFLIGIILLSFAIGSIYIFYKLDVWYRATLPPPEPKKLIPKPVIPPPAPHPYGLTCSKCSKLANPINGTSNRYRCDKCGNQFASDRHDC